MMKDDKLIELFRRYAKTSTPTKLPDEAYTLDGVLPSAYWAVQAHAAWMAGEAIKFIEEAQAIDERPGQSGHSKREKAHRWLGFIQGVLWMAGTFTLDQLKEHSKKCSDDYVEPT